MSRERREELERLFWNETNEEWTQEWRDELTPGEAAMVCEWDEQVCHDMALMARAILAAEARC